jgi:L-threonylcarbamoyladenylate synthase
VSQFLSKCDASVLDNAATTLMAGGLVAFPTETVYGLGADASNEMAIARIYAVKARPTDHPLIVHVASMDALGEWASDVPEYAISLARDFWPGPMTLVLRRSELAGDFLTGGQETVGVRVPAHPIALGLLEAFVKAGGKGIAAPSANRFGNVSPTTAQAVAAELGDYLAASDQIIDGGACDVGVESTIIDCTGDAPSILRPGAVTGQMISQSTNLPCGSRFTYTDEDLPGITLNGNPIKTEAIRVSGSLESHYAPLAKVVLNKSPLQGQGFIAMADVVSGEGVVRLAAPATHEDFARVLYAALRAADEKGLDTVVVQEPQGEGIAIAIRDRLKRAAHGSAKELDH